MNLQGVPTLSIIIPTYNRSQKLLRCLESLVISNCFDFEVVVVDDGSDIPIELKQSFPFSLTFLRQANQGPGVARNFGAKHAKGDLLLFLDDDCFATEKTVKSALKYFALNPHIAVLGPNFLVSEDANSIEQMLVERTRLKMVATEPITVPFISSSAFFIRRSTFEAVGGFDPAYLICEDVDLIQRLKLQKTLIWRLPSLQVTHAKECKNIFALFSKAKLWSSEDSDRALLQHNLLGSEGLFESYYHLKRVQFLKDSSLLNFFYFFVASFLFGVSDMVFVLFHFFSKGKTCALRLLWGVMLNWHVLIRYTKRYIQNQFGFLRPLRRSWLHIKHASSSSTPLRLILFVTSKCQADCDHCFYFEHLNSKNPEISLEEYAKLSKNCGKVLRINITGGEPFLRNDLPEIIQLFYRNNRLEEISIPTNGYLTEKITSTTKEILRRCPSLRLSLSISIDGEPAVHDQIRKVPGGYQKATATLEALTLLRSSESRLRVGINSTYMPANSSSFLSFLTKTRKQFQALDFVHAAFSYQRLERGLSKNRFMQQAMTDFEWRKLVFAFSSIWTGKSSLLERLRSHRNDLILREAEKTGKQPLPCKAHRLFAVVRENGDVHYCEEREKIGSLFEAPLSTLLQSDLGKSVARSIENKECACTHCIFQESNVIAQPFSFQTLGLWVKSMLSTATFIFESKSLRVPELDSKTA